MKRKLNKWDLLNQRIGLSVIIFGLCLILSVLSIVSSTVDKIFAQTPNAPKVISVQAMPEVVDSTVAHVVSKIKNDDGKTETVEIVVIAHVHHGGAYDSHPIRTVDLKLPLNTTNAQIKAAFLNSMKNPEPTPTPDTL